LPKSAPIRASADDLILVQFGVNTTTEIWQFYLWHELYEDFCRDSLVQRLPGGDHMLNLMPGVRPVTSRQSSQALVA